MSSEEAEQLTEQFEKKWNNQQRRTFISRMEHKHFRKENYGKS